MRVLSLQVTDIADDTAQARLAEGTVLRTHQGKPLHGAKIQFRERLQRNSRGDIREIQAGRREDYKVKFTASEDMNHIEAKVLEFVARLFPDIFSALDDYRATNVGYLDETVAGFDREIQFYIAYIEYIAGLKGGGLRFCYPASPTRQGDMRLEAFDIALAHKLKAQKSPVVCNDFHLEGKERILVVTGPNQGGKTTFARAFGQLHYLASSAVLFRPRRRSFSSSTPCLRILNGRKRSKISAASSRTTCSERQVLDRATPRSVIVMNEIFTSTTLKDETFLSAKLMKKLIELDVLAVWVTFVDELASFGPETVSMVSTVVPDTGVRTFKIVRRPADGLAYAMAIAQKYGRPMNPSNSGSIMKAFLMYRDGDFDPEQLLLQREKEFGYRTANPALSSRSCRGTQTLLPRISGSTFSSTRWRETTVSARSRESRNFIRGNGPETILYRQRIFWTA